MDLRIPKGLTLGVFYQLTINGLSKECLLGEDDGVTGPGSKHSSLRAELYPIVRICQ